MPRLLFIVLALSWLPFAGGAAPPPALETTRDFVAVAAGPFTMGADRSSDADAFDNERWSADAAQGTVDLPAFYMSRYETTVAEYAEFVAATGWRVDARALAGPPTHPVTHVSWPDALAFCRWLDRTLKQWPAGTSAASWRVTLPTEAQWEKAARGTDARRYPWGHTMQPARANVQSAGTTPVGFFKCPECAHGLADMSGNVWEWTSSPYQPYPYREDDDRDNLGADALWVIRGGHFGDDARMVRTTARTGADPGARRPFIGFRVALTPRAVTAR